MKYRVRCDLSFDREADAKLLMDYDLEICRHDEGLPCTRLGRIEIRKL